MDKDKYEAQFMQMIMGLQSTAWMLLGKIMNPMTGKIEKNLDSAKATIDTLVMLKEKTKGNLTKTEKELLNNSIQQLQMNYIEESEKIESKKDSEEKKQEKTEENKNNQAHEETKTENKDDKEE
ncbi:DUF1844 domain-containing protein [Candidatus Woesearchaeota archaeon]|nr:DUF1844 domain-containing protein [Candidatus Woesearchaeota archaeon]